MSARKNFDRLLAKHTRKLSDHRRTVIMTGDLNVNPRMQDSHPLAFLQCNKLKKQSGLQEDPGCSYQEVSMYHKIIKEMRGVNVWEHLKPNSRQGMTWHSIQIEKIASTTEDSALIILLCLTISQMAPTSGKLMTSRFSREWEAPTIALYYCC